MTYGRAVKEFSDACSEEPLPSRPEMMDEVAVEFIIEMVNDELGELREATDVAEQADALVDAIYYICDSAARHGINLDRVFEIVQGANMAKVVDGRVIRREDGKILKPQGWQDPAELLVAEMQRQQREGSWA